LVSVLSYLEIERVKRKESVLAFGTAYYANRLVEFITSDFDTKNIGIVESKEK